MERWRQSGRNPPPQCPPLTAGGAAANDRSGSASVEPTRGEDLAQPLVDVARLAERVDRGELVALAEAGGDRLGLAAVDVEAVGGSFPGGGLAAGEGGRPARAGGAAGAG